MNDYKDEELMMMLKQGNTAAFDLLFERYRNRVFSFITRMLNGDREAAEDLYQEIFIKVFKGRDFYEPTAAFSTWLFTIARNHCLNYLKSKRYMQNQQTVSLDGETGSRKAEASGAEDPQKEYERLELRDALDAAICQLPDKYREVFLLHAVEGFSHEEIAAMLGMNAATIRSHYHRARQLLVEKLGTALSIEREF